MSTKTLPPTDGLLNCPFCGARPRGISMGYEGPGGWVPWPTVGCPADDGGCGAMQSARTLSEVHDKWNRRAPDGDHLRIIQAAMTNHIWISAMHVIRPTPEFERDLGRQLLQMVKVPRNLVILDQESPHEAERTLGRLTPTLFLRVTKS